MAKVPSELKAKLKQCEPIVRDYIAQLEARNAKRQRQIVQFEADKVELDGRIKALEQQLKEKKVDIRYNIDLHRSKGNLEEVAKEIASLREKLIRDLRSDGYTVTPPA